VSAGCKNCYAETVAKRFGAPAYPNGFDITLRPHRLKDPARWQKPARVFVNSMSDLFHADIPRSYRDEILDTISECPQHVFQVLTKRADEMLLEMLRWYNDCECGVFGECLRCAATPLPNLWLGVSVENTKTIDRIQVLRETPAAVRFISAEPLLGSLAPLDLSGIDWVIIGGESGSSARPMEVSWALEIIAAARQAGCAVFVKQLPTRSAMRRSLGVQ
jgi:protein gp37